MGGIDHAEENRESGLLNVVRVLDTVDGGSPIHAQAPHLIRLHDRVRSVEPPVADERKEEEGRLTKLERLVILEDVADTADERRFCRVEALEGFDGDGTRGVSQRSQSILNWFVLVSPSGGQVEVVVQESENVVWILDPWQEFVPLVGTMHGESGGIPLLLLRVGERNGGLHDDVEQTITLLSDVVLRERSDKFHGFQCTVDLVGGWGGVPERLREFIVDSIDLRVDFVAVIGQISFISR